MCSARLQPHGRTGRCQSLPALHAMAFAMGSHKRLGSAGLRAPAGDMYTRLHHDLIKNIVLACRGKPQGLAGSLEGVMRMIGGGGIMPEVLLVAPAPGGPAAQA